MGLLNYWLGPNLPQQDIDHDKSAFSKYLKQPLKRHLAHFYAPILTSMGAEIIGITGTAGKTTLKDMLRSVLSTQFSTTASRANINPAFNIPNTLLQSPPGTKKIILEMGVEYPRDMDFYLWLARPKVGILTSIYHAHTEFFGDIDGVAKEKGKLVAGLPEDGVAILNLDDQRVIEMARLTKAKILTFSTKDSKADCYASNIKISDNFHTNFDLHLSQDSKQVSMPIPGEHFASLACAATLAGQNAGISLDKIITGLESFTPPPHRMVPHDLGSKGILIDDTYNANPLAVEAAIEIVSKIAGNKKKIMVLGEMKELGEYAQKGHEDVGKSLGKHGFDVLITLGELPKYTAEQAIKNGIKAKNVYQANSKDEIIQLLKNLMEENTITLIKGSRSMKMEEVVEDILASKIDK